MPGEQLAGSVCATDFVAWYSGHPDLSPDRFELAERAVAVVGAGAGSRVQEVHAVVRRGPVQARFTARELRELGEMADADVLVDPGELELDDLSRAALGCNQAARRNLELLRTWALRPPAGRTRRVRLPSPGQYVAGWAKRGPTEVIITDKHDARDTAAPPGCHRPRQAPRRRRGPPAVDASRRTRDPAASGSGEAWCRGCRSLSRRNPVPAVVSMLRAAHGTGIAAIR